MSYIMQSGTGALLYMDHWKDAGLGYLGSTEAKHVYAQASSFAQATQKLRNIVRPLTNFTGL